MLNRQNPSAKPQYKFYATLLDAFAWYLKSDEPEALQQFIDKVNRVPFTSEAAAKGTAFNNLIDNIIHNGYDKFGEVYTCFDGFEFPTDIVIYFAQYYKNASSQVYIEATLPTSKGNVLLYGYIDEVMFGSADDIKTTSKYDFPKYLNNWQHIVYPYCLIENGVHPDSASIFSYHITDFRNIFKEDYVYNPVRDKQRLINMCERLIEFLELRRNDIANKKVFALDEEKVLVSEKVN